MRIRALIITSSENSRPPHQSPEDRGVMPYLIESSFELLDGATGGAYLEDLAVRIDWDLARTAQPSFGSSSTAFADHLDVVILLVKQLDRRLAESAPTSIPMTDSDG